METAHYPPFTLINFFWWREDAKNTTLLEHCHKAYQSLGTKDSIPCMFPVEGVSCGWEMPAQVVEVRRGMPHIALPLHNLISALCLDHDMSSTLYRCTIRLLALWGIMGYAMFGNCILYRDQVTEVQSRQLQEAGAIETQVCSVWPWESVCIPEEPFPHPSFNLHLFQHPYVVYMKMSSDAQHLHLKHYIDC